MLLNIKLIDQPFDMKINDFKVGQTAEISKSFSADDVLMFSQLSLDNNPVHLDHEYAKNTIFKNKIVHGYLYGSLISAVIGTKLPGYGAIYLHQEMNFKKPVYLDEEVTAQVNISDINYEKSILYLNTICFKNKQEIVLEGKAIIKLI